MAGQNKTAYDSLLQTEVVEFFYLLETYKKNLEIKKAGITPNNKK